MLRSRIVELRIDDVAGFLEQFGVQVEFWMIKASTGAGAKWVVPIRPSAMAGEVSDVSTGALRERDASPRRPTLTLEPEC